MRLSTRFRSVVVLLTLWSVALSASAQSQSVVVLGIRSLEGDDDIALALSQALRSAAAGVSQWSVGDQSISLAQMMLVHNCDEPDEACLANIAAGLGAPAIVFGSMHRNALQASFEYQVDLGFFDAASGSVTARANESISQKETDETALKAKADHGVVSLTQAPATAPAVAAADVAVSVLAAVEGAQVYMDGQLVGAIKFGRLDLPAVPAGQHQFRVIADGHEPYEVETDIQGEGPVEVRASLSSNLTPTVMAAGDIETESGGFRIFGRTAIELLPYALIGVGVLSAGGMIASMVVANGAESDPAYTKYESLVSQNDPLAEDVCVRADQQHTFGGAVSASDTIRVSDLCDRADAFRALEYVFAGVAAASTIGGITLLVLSKRDEKPATDGDVSFSLHPVLGRRTNGLRATIHF